jgi:hypothetical protein
MEPRDLQRMQSAQGYLSLGLPEDAAKELDALSPELRDTLPVMILRLEIARDLADWSTVRTFALRLLEKQPDEPAWHVELAYATRRCLGLPAARDLLRAAATRFPRHAIIPYNLACYAAQSGEATEACSLLQHAFQLDPGLLRTAETDADLDPIRDQIARLFPSTAADSPDWTA